ncbi:hypothetical protein GOODEAATRI_005375 [Goodea atripinnis]|uniref:Uncharacterized protein n=1 Tax=Goodea atripinnis TaxID=208336 RepID=A0ABV0N887_9TELE
MKTDLELWNVRILVMFLETEMDAARSPHCPLWLIICCECLFVLAECKPGFFKAETSSEKCEPCPANTQGQEPGALFCPCMNGFYRADTDPINGPCSGKLLLSWLPPEDTGGRNDITYTVECQRCEGSLCQFCGEKIRYEPANTGLTDTKVSVSELDPYFNYTFAIHPKLLLCVWLNGTPPVCLCPGMFSLVHGSNPSLSAMNSPTARRSNHAVHSDHHPFPAQTVSKRPTLLPTLLILSR